MWYTQIVSTDPIKARDCTNRKTIVQVHATYQAGVEGGEWWGGGWGRGGEAHLREVGHFSSQDLSLLPFHKVFVLPFTEIPEAFLEAISETFIPAPQTPFNDLTPKQGSTGTALAPNKDYKYENLCTYNLCPKGAAKLSEKLWSSKEDLLQTTQFINTTEPDVWGLIG